MKILKIEEKYFFIILKIEKYNLKELQLIINNFVLPNSYLFVLVKHKLKLSSIIFFKKFF